jgi:hypothetical protein
MLQRLGDGRISMCFFETTKPPFNAIQQTTWSELQQSNYLKANLKRYRLTAAGWLRALQESLNERARFIVIRKLRSLSLSWCSGRIVDNPDVIHLPMF